MQNLSLDLLVLNAACDDWENVASIRAAVETVEPVDGSILEECLLRLARNGLLDAHEFSDGTFVRLDPDTLSAESISHLWFFVSPSGRRLLDASEVFFGSSPAT